MDRLTDVAIAELAYDGRVYIADTSAWDKASDRRVTGDWSQALRNHQLATCPIVKLELLYAARDGQSFDRLDTMLTALRDIAVTRSVTNAALAAYRHLAYHQPLYHRSMKFGDLLIAACAEDAAVGVLHYDHHFDRLAEVLEFESRWISPAGSL